MRPVVVVFLTAGYLLAQDQTAQISGTVVDAHTRQPVSKATVNLNYLGGVNLNNLTGPFAADHGIQAASTDATGTFSFDALPEGRYVLTTTHQGYPQLAKRPHRIVEIKSGEKASSITLELIPGAVITGHVADEDGDPLPGCFVQAVHSRRQGGGSNSDQDGEYRIHGLAPGKYALSVRCGNAVFAPRPFSAGPDPPPSLAYAMQYYPLAADAKSAQPIDLAPGVEKPGVDFRVRTTPITQIHGSISSSGADWRAAGGLNVQLIPIGGEDSETYGSPFNPEKGLFEFSTVFPGSYYLLAMSFGDPASRVFAIERIEVKDHPVEVVLTLSHGVDLAGSVSIEDNNSANKVPLNQIQVHVEPEPQLRMLGLAQAQVKDDGTFVIKSVPLGHWKLRLISQQAYLKSAWLGSTDITQTAFDVTTASEALRIAAGTNMGTLTGTAPAGELVYAASDDRMQHQVQADPTGRFTLPQLPPGKYRVGVADPLSPAPDEGGQEITIHEGETVTVDLKQN